jgi:hypothetical protein
LDKIELDVEIADPLREYTTSKDSKLFDKDFGGRYFCEPNEINKSQGPF